MVYADQSTGVTKEMLYEYTEGLSEDEYAVYRLRDLDPDCDPGEQMWPGPMVSFALFMAYGKPFDEQFILGDGAYYNAELAYQSALNAGVVPGAPMRLQSLVRDPGTLDGDFRKALEGHRYCRYEPSFEECWSDDPRDQSIVTTDSLIGSGALQKVFP